MDATEEGWFGLADRVDSDAAAVREGRAEEPREWTRLAVERDAVADESAYYERLHEATLAATREAVEEYGASDDRQLVHAVRALDDLARTANELTERVAEWAGGLDPDATVDSTYVRELAGRDPDSPAERQLVELAGRVADLDEKRERLRTHIERAAPGVAPNLSALAGPVLAARLIALAGGLEDLARQPSGTVQVLGAEDALFAHLRGTAAPPKHGVIYTHEAVSGTAPDQRGSAARALAGKLTIAARIDHYSGDRRPELAAELDERIERIRARDSA
jgi:nucleolar protein 56